MAQWLNWLERRPVTPEVVGSSPIWVVSILSLEYFNKSRNIAIMNVNSIKKLNYINTFPGRIAQLGEHLPYKQGVTGSSPVAPILFAQKLDINN